MAPEEFRAIAAGLPEVTEGEHVGLVTLLVRGKRFCTIGWPAAGQAVLMLAPADQAVLVGGAPDVFAAQPGIWGARGHTAIHLDRADAATALSGLRAAWRAKAPKSLAKSVP
jgi:hypothetical protein